MRDEATRTRTIAGLTFRAWALTLVGVHLVAGLLLYEPAIFPGGDNAGYMILGESLRTGVGYRDLYLPGTPLHAKYPPFFPAILSVIGLFGGVQLFKLTSLACTAGVVWLTARVGRRLFGAGIGLVTAGVLAVNSVLLEYSHYVLSEALFTFLVMLALFLVGSPEEREAGTEGDPGWAGRPGSWVILAVVAAVAAFLTRTAGLVLLAALPVGALLAGRYRRAGWSASIGLAVMLGWALFQRLGAPGRASYLQELVLRNPYEPAGGSVSLPGLIGRAATNAWTYVSSVLPATFAGAPSLSASSAPWLAALGILVGALILAGWADRAAGRPTVPEIFALFYAGLIVIWPEVWTDKRFLLPLLPLLVLYALRGAARVAETVKRPGAPRVAIGILAGVTITSGLLGAARLIPERMRCVAAYRAGSPCDPAAQASFYRAARWAAENTEPDAVVANRKPNLFFWFGRRQGDLYRYSAEPEVVLAGLRELGAEYVVVDQISATTIRYLVPAIQQNRDQFDLVYEGGEPPTLIFRFRPEARTALGAGSDADLGR